MRISTVIVSFFSVFVFAQGTLAALTLQQVVNNVNIIAVVSKDTNSALSQLITTCKASTLQGETHRHQYKPDRIYTGAYTKVQMSSLSKNRLKRRYICWHHQRVIPNNYKYPRGSNNVRGE